MRSCKSGVEKHGTLAHSSCPRQQVIKPCGHRPAYKIAGPSSRPQATGAFRSHFVASYLILKIDFRCKKATFSRGGLVFRTEIRGVTGFRLMWRSPKQDALENCRSKFLFAGSDREAMQKSSSCVSIDLLDDRDDLLSAATFKQFF